MKIKTFAWGVDNAWNDFDTEVNQFIADKQVISFQTSDSQSVSEGYFHTLTIAYLEVSK